MSFRFHSFIFILLTCCALASYAREYEGPCSGLKQLPPPLPKLIQNHQLSTVFAQQNYYCEFLNMTPISASEANWLKIIKIDGKKKTTLAIFAYISTNSQKAADENENCQWKYLGRSDENALPENNYICNNQ